MATVLIVDDSSMARRNLRNILLTEGHTVLAEATNGVQAFVEYEKHRPDLVTMDISMPILNGIDGTKKILFTYPDAKIVMVSALNQKLMILAALQHGAKHYIIKPFSHEKVIEVVNEVLNISCKLPQNSDNFATHPNDIKNSLPPVPVQHSPSEAVVRPFFIESKEGISVVNISKSMCNKYLPALKLGIQRLTSSKPIKVAFNFGDMEVIEEDTFNEIKDILENIVNLGGSCVMTSSNQDFVTTISEKESSLPIRLFSEVLDPSKLDI